MYNTIRRLSSFLLIFVLTFGPACRAQALAALEPMVPKQPAFTPSGKVYYVSTTGKDTNSGAAGSPFQTFTQAVSVLSAGDTLQVMPGTYYETMKLTMSGTAARPINVAGNGAVLALQGSLAFGIKISGSYINVSNFEVTGATEAGIAISGRYVTVANNILHDNVTENGIGKCGTARSWLSALKVGIGGQHITIENNIVYNNCGEGIAITRGNYVTVRNNTVYDNFAPNIYIDNSPYTIVQDNRVYCTGARLRRDGTRPTGIGLGEEYYDGWGAQMHDILVSGNSIKDCGKGIGAFKSEVGGTLTNVTITKNDVPNGMSRSISLTNASNKNVVISFNNLFNEPYLTDSVGVSLIGNTITRPTSSVPPESEISRRRQHGR